MGAPATNYGVYFALTNTTGTYRMITYLSSTGTSYDIAAGTSGTKTTWSTGVWYHAAITYDPVQAKYFSYIDGVLDNTTSSTALICAVQGIRIGAETSGAGYGFDGWFDGFRYSPYCRYPNGTTFTPPASAPAVEGDFFSIPKMKMYSITGASTSAGTDPTMTAIQRVYCGEAVTGASSVSSVVNYALRGQTYVENSANTTATRTQRRHTLGCIPLNQKMVLVNLTGENGYSTGDIVQDFPNFSDGSNPRIVGATSDTINASITTNTAFIEMPQKNTYNWVNATPANWKTCLYLNRGW